MKDMKSVSRSGLLSSGPVRPVVAAFPFVAAIVTAATIYASLSTRLPDPLATHFSIDGRADGYSATHGFLTEFLVALLVLGVGFGLLSRLRVPSAATPWLIATGYALAAGLGFPLCLTLLGNADVADASAVRLPPWQLAMTFVVVLLAGALGRLLGGVAPRPPKPEPAAAPRLDLPAGTTAGWSRTVSSPPLVALGALMLSAGLVLVLVGGGLSGVPLLASGAVVLAVTSVRVTVDRRGLTLAPTLLPAGIRFRRIPLDQVAEAASRQIVPFAEFGGWGYRIRSDRSGLVLRSGEGMVVLLTSGRQFMVTVDDAATAAALLNTYADRARSRQGG